MDPTTASEREHTEPHEPSAQGWALFRIAGIQIRIDPSWLLIFALIWWSLSAGYFPRIEPNAPGRQIVLAGLLAALLFFLSLLVHELSHSIVARRAGLEVTSIRLFLFGGVSEMTREPDDPRTELRIAIVGPLASFVLAVVFWAIGGALPAATPPLLAGVVDYLAAINLALGVFNLLPGFPLDGGRVLRAIVWWRTGSLMHATAIATRTGKGLGLGLAFLGAIEIFQGALLGGIWLILIGLFARSLAESSQQSVRLRHTLARVTVGDAMAAHPVTVSADCTIEELMEDYVLAHGFRAFPVLDGGRLVGLVTLEAVKGVPLAERSRARVRDHLVPLDAERCVAPETPLVDALARMGRTGARQLLVLRTGTTELAGLLTRTALARFLEIREALADAPPETGAHGHGHRPPPRHGSTSL